MNTCRRYPNIQKKSKKDDVFTIVSGAPGARDNFNSDNEFATYIWSFLSPPAISQPTPIISADRYERVRKALEPPRIPADGDCDTTHIKTSIHVDQLDDGTLVKTKSKTEVRTYTNYVDSSKKCEEYCDPKCTHITLGEVPGAFETFLEDEGVDYFASRFEMEDD